MYFQGDISIFKETINSIWSIKTEIVSNYPKDIKR